jgi:hypothetical protein
MAHADATHAAASNATMSRGRGKIHDGITSQGAMLEESIRVLTVTLSGDSESSPL